MELYIIRHGETQWNKEMRLQGRSDVPLNENGIRLAQITAKALKDVSFDVIYSSPLTRAYQTAEILRKDRDVEIIKDDRLIEMSFGVYEGVRTEEIPSQFANFFQHPELYCPPERGESYPQIIARAKTFLEEVVVPNAACMTRMLVVAHGALNKALMVNLNHQEIKDFWSGVFQRNCCVNIYDIHDHSFRLIQNGKIYYDDKEGTSW